MSRPGILRVCPSSPSALLFRCVQIPCRAVRFGGARSPCGLSRARLGNRACHRSCRREPSCGRARRVVAVSQKHGAGVSTSPEDDGHDHPVFQAPVRPAADLTLAVALLPFSTSGCRSTSSRFAARHCQASPPAPAHKPPVPSGLELPHWHSPSPGVRYCGAPEQFQNAPAGGCGASVPPGLPSPLPGTGAHEFGTRMRQWIICLLFTSGLGASSLNAQALSLGEARARAVQASPELAAAQAAVEAAARARQAGALQPGPQLLPGTNLWCRTHQLAKHRAAGAAPRFRRAARRKTGGGKIASRSRHGASWQSGQRRSSTRRPERMPQPSPPISVPRGRAKGPRRSCGPNGSPPSGWPAETSRGTPAGGSGGSARYAAPRRGGAPAADRPPGPCDAAGRHRRLGADARASAGRGARDRPRRSAARFLARSGHSLPSRISAPFTPRPAPAPRTRGCPAGGVSRSARGRRIQVRARRGIGTDGQWICAPALAAGAPLGQPPRRVVRIRRGEAGSASPEDRIRRIIAREVETAWAERRAIREQIEAIRPLLGPSARWRSAPRRRPTRRERSRWWNGSMRYRRPQEAESSFATLVAGYVIQRAALERRRVSIEESSHVTFSAAVPGRFSRDAEADRAPEQAAAPPGGSVTLWTDSTELFME